MPKTQITSKQLFERRNTTDVFDRLVIIGLLRTLNRKLVYEQVWSDMEGGIQNITVPFFYDFGGSNQNTERFIQDNYTFFSSDECTDMNLKKIDGNFDFYPQGRISLSSVSIDAGNITNRFAMGRYTKVIDGRLQTFTSYLYSMPLQFQFQMEIRAENMNTAFKIDQALREFFYKNKTFHFNYRGTVVPCRVGFPESAMNLQAGSSFTFGAAPTDNYIKLAMNIQCETYQPVFDPFSERPADTSIGSPGVNIFVNTGNYPHPQQEETLYFVTQFKNMVLISGQDILLEWNWSYPDRDLLMTEILYQIENDETEYMIDCVDNHNFYHWRIPQEFTSNEAIDFIVPNSDAVQVATAPQIVLYADPQTRMVEPENVLVKNKGFFITQDPDGTVPAIISYTDSKGDIREYEATIHLHNFMIDEGPGSIEFECFLYENEIQSQKIRFVLRDHNRRNVTARGEWISIV